MGRKRVLKRKKARNTNNPENRLQDENEGDFGGSFFDEPSVDFPEADFIADMGARAAGVERHSDGQSLFIGIARKLGYRVVFDSNLKTETGAPARGKIDYEKKTIYLNPKTDKPLQFAFGHELTHYGESSELYDKFITAIRTSKVYLQWLKNKTGSDSASLGELEGLYRERVMASRKNAAPVGAAEAQQEMYADFCGETFFSDSESGLQHLMDGLDRKHHSKVIQFVLDFVSYLKEKLSGNKQITLELVKLESRYTKMLKSAKENTTQESGVKYSLTTYSKHQIENWKNSKSIIVYETEEQLRQFIQDAKKGKNLNKKMYFGAISQKLSDRIKKDTGLDVNKYNCTLRASEVRKIFDDHGNEEKESLRGQRAITEDDFVSIPKIIQNPDEIILSDNLFEGKPVIKFVKTINGKTTVAAYISAKHLDLTVQTMYSGKNKRSLAIAAGEQAPANTPEANAGTTPIDSIIDNESTVKNNSMQKNGKYSISLEENLENSVESETDIVDIPTEMSFLMRQYQNGEFDEDTFRERMDEIYNTALNRFGIIPEGENAQSPISVPKKVSENKTTERFVRNSSKTVNNEATSNNGDCFLLR